MSRTIIKLESKDNESLSKIIDNILLSNGYEYTNYNENEQAWNQGIGVMKAPKFIKYYFEGNTLILEGWIGKGREQELKGVIAALPKGDVKKVLKKIENAVTEFNQNPTPPVTNEQTNNINKTIENKPSNVENTDNTSPSNMPNNNNNTSFNNQTNTSQKIETTSQIPTNKNNTGRIIYDVIGIIISIIILIGAASGVLVFRGTNSSGLLFVFILIILIYEIYTLIKHLNENSKANKNKNYSPPRSVNDYPNSNPFINNDSRENKETTSTNAENADQKLVQQTNTDNIKEEPENNNENKKEEKTTENLNTQDLTNNAFQQLPPQNNTQQNNQIPNNNVPPTYNMNNPNIPQYNKNRYVPPTPNQNNNPPNMGVNQTPPGINPPGRSSGLTKNSKIIIAIVVVLLIALVGAFIIFSTGSDYDDEYSSSNFGSVDATVSISDITVDDDRSSDYSWSYSYFVYVTFANANSLDSDCYLTIDYLDSSGSIVNSDTYYSLSSVYSGEEVQVSSYFADKKAVSKIRVKLYDGNDKLISEDERSVK